MFCHQVHSHQEGQFRIASKPIDAETQAHTTKMLSKLVTQTKRPTPEAQPHMISPIATSGNSSNNAWAVPRPQKTALPTNQSEPEPNSDTASNCPSEAERRFTILEQNALQSSERIDRLENICTQLMHNTEMISNQIQQLASDYYNPESSSHQPKTEAAKLS